jgi:putative inorganic carbon (HCO3(-)) transporter
LLGSFQEITGKTIVENRTSGTLGHPNGYAMYLSATVSFAFAFLFARIHVLIKVLLSFVICAAVLGIILSQSRGGWIGLALVFIFVFGFALHRKRQSPRKALIVGAAGLLILFPLFFGQRHLIESRITSDDQGSAHSRIIMAKGAIGILRDYPLLGVGLNNYALLVPQLDPASIRAAGGITSVHNIFLLIAAETGLIGFTAFAWLLASLFVQARRLAGRAQNEFMWVAGAAVFSGYVALSLHGMVDYALLANMPLFRLFWLFAGVIAGLGANAFNNPTTNDT